MGEGQVVFRRRPLDPARPLLGPMLASGALLTAIRRTIAVVCVVFAVLSVVIGSSASISRADTLSRWVTGALAVGALSCAVWTLRARRPLAGRGAVALGVFADCGVVAVLAMVRDPFTAAFGAFVLALPGVFVMIHLARVWLAAHLALASATIVVLATRVGVEGREPLPVVVSGGLVLAAVLVATPWTLRRSFLHVLDRAERAFFDPVTGVLNRWGLDAVVAGLASAPPGAAVTVVVVDIDRFKAVNDAHGHDVGDRVLRQVAVDLSRFADSRGGVVARTGGEEFAVVLPGTLDDLSGIPVASGGQDGPSVTLSSGVVEAQVRELTGGHVATVLSDADRLMYAAKRAGGGRATRLGVDPRAAS